MMPAFGCLLLTLLIYWASKSLYRRVPKVLLSPLLVTPAAVIAVIECFGIPYATYNGGGQWLTDMIGPATVALAVPLYKNLGVLRKHAATIAISVFSGAVIAILSSASMAKWLHLNASLIDSLAPRSATTPIAMAVSQGLGGVPNITAVFVMVTGLLGMILGPVVVRAFRIKNDIARGVLFGTSSHTAGTSKAFEFGSVSGTISGIAMILTAFVTLCTAPLLLHMFY